jgi:serine protease
MVITVVDEGGDYYDLIFSVFLFNCFKGKHVFKNNEKPRSDLMRARILLISLVLGIVAFSAPNSSAALSQQSAIHVEAGVEYMPDIIVVAFVEDYSPLQTYMSDGTILTGIEEVDELNRNFSAFKMRSLFPGAEKHGRLDMAGYYAISFEDAPELMTLLEAYDKLDAVEHVEPDGIHPVFYEPNDPMLNQQWALVNVQAREAWDICQGNPEIILGIPDTGVDWDHPDLEADVWENEAEINGDERVDDDGNGYEDDYRGWDWVTGGYLCDVGGGEDCYTADNDPMDFAGHGSHCGGIAAAVTDNGVGISGLGFNCKIMALRIGWHATDGNGYIGMSFAASAFYYATDNGAVGLSCSWGSSNSGGLGAATDYAISHGLIVVTAAGNSNNQTPSYLGNRTDVMAVAATNSSDQKASFSCYGSWVDVSAPGVNIRSTIFDDSYANWDGTSMASPHVLGLAGLIWSAEPELTRQEVVDRIEDTADNIDGLNPGYEGLLGSGRINAYAALASTNLPNFVADDMEMTITNDDGDGILNPGESMELVVTLHNIWADGQNITGVLRGNDQFSVIDSMADFGDIPHDGYGDNSGSPYTVSVEEDALTGPSELTLHLEADGDFESDLDLEIVISLDQLGFPLEIPGNIESSPLMVDFDSDGDVEILFGSNDDMVYAIEPDGGNSPGWPKDVDGDVISGPAVGDLEGDGDLEVVAVSKAGFIYAWNADGSPLTGFPVNKGVVFYSGPLLMDLDGDDDLEIVAGAFSGAYNIYVLNDDGSDLEGWPVAGQNRWYGSPASADIDGDGLSEIVYAGFDSYLNVYDADGGQVEGFPVSLDDVVWSSVSIGDVDDDELPEIAVATASGSLYLVNDDGSVDGDFPVNVGTVVRSAPSMADLDGDGSPEVLFGTNDGHLYVVDADGSYLPGFPVETGGSISASAVVGDLTGDGLPDIVVAAGDGVLYGYDAAGADLRNFPIPGSTTGQMSATPALGDLDGDGDLEVTVGMSGAGTNLMVIDYKEQVSLANLQWLNFGRYMNRSHDFSVVITSVDDRVSVPQEFTLDQNYPNPFNAQTTIRFTLPSSGDAELTVYDLLGRRINVLHSGYLSAGEHSLVWDGSNQSGAVVSSGIYFYRLESAGVSKTMRMLLLK